MRKDVIISVRTSDGAILNENQQFGITGENYQGNLIFQLDKPIQGAGTILVTINNNTNLTINAAHNTTYTEYYIPILNTLLIQDGLINVQLKVTEPLIDAHTPSFMSQVVTGYIPIALVDAMGEPEEYSDWIDTINELRVDVESAESDIDTLQNDMTTAQGDIDTLETKMTNAEGDIDSLEGRMTIAEKDIDDAEEDITSLKGRMSTAEDNISTNTNNIRTNADDIDVLETHMGTAENNITSLTQRMNSVEGRLDTLEGKVRTLEEKVSTLENKVQNLERYNYLVIEGE